jgi:ATP-dependent exoDNAse (exonuclease V) beta subunit
LTRARDRLYLGTTLKEGVLVPGRGGLAEVLPDSLKALFSRAQATFDELDTIGWTGISGHEYAWRLCRPAARPAAAAPPADAQDTSPVVDADDFAAPDASAGCPRISVSEFAGEPAEADLSTEAPRSDRLLGVVIHRLFELASHESGSKDAAATRALIERALRADERAVLEDPEAFITAAAEVWMRVRERADVTVAMQGAERLHEVPFSLWTSDGAGARMIRGSIDCLVRREDGRLAVVELKTGRPRSAHQLQLDLYVRAAQALHPGVQVDGVLLYL